MMRLTSARQSGDQARAAALQAMETASAQDVDPQGLGLLRTLELFVMKACEPRRNL